MRFIALLVLVHLSCSPAIIHDLLRVRDDGRYAGSPLKEWFDGLHSGKGPCCSDADGSVLADVDWEVTSKGYRVRIQDLDGPMVWMDVPEDAVLNEPNRYGKTMVWPMYRDGHVTIRCFIAGSLT